MKINTMQSIVQQLPAIMDYLKIPKEYQQDHGHLLGDANQSRPSLTSDIELLVGSDKAKCQYKLVFDYNGTLTQILFADEIYGAVDWRPRSLPPSSRLKNQSLQSMQTVKTVAKNVGKTVGKFAIAFGKQLFDIEGQRRRR